MTELLLPTANSSPIGNNFILDKQYFEHAYQYGQTLTVEETEKNEIYWKSIDSENKIWFEAKFSTIRNNCSTHRET